MAENQQKPQQQQAPPAAPIPMPYIPTDEEQAYLAACAKAITDGCEAASSAAAASNGDQFDKFASGVKALTDAYEAIKNGGKPSRHEGS